MDSHLAWDTLRKTGVITPILLTGRVMNGLSARLKPALSEVQILASPVPSLPSPTGRISSEQLTKTAECPGP